MELETHLSSAGELALVAEHQGLSAKAADVGKMLNRLIQALKRLIT